MAMDIETGAGLIIKAQEQERDERLFRQWTAQLPVMAMSGNVIGFDEYRDRMTGANIDLRPTTEILAELDEIEKQLGKEETGIGT